MATVKDWSTGVAAFQFVSPDWEARTVTAPVPVRLSVLLEIVAGPERTLKLTGRPEEAVALRVNGGSLYVLSASGPKLMV